MKKTAQYVQQIDSKLSEIESLPADRTTQALHAIMTRARNILTKPKEDDKTGEAPIR